MNTRDDRVEANNEEEVTPEQLIALLEKRTMTFGRTAGEGTLTRLCAAAEEGSRSNARISSQKLKALKDEQRLEKVFNKEVVRRETKFESFKTGLHAARKTKKSDLIIKRAKRIVGIYSVPGLFAMATVTMVFGFMSQVESQFCTKRAIQLIAKGETKQAYGLLQKSLIWNPYNAKASYEAGRIDEKQKNRDEAFSHFSRALKANPDDVDVLDHKGALAIKLKQFDVAAETYTHLLRVSKNARKQLHHYGNRAVAYSQLGQYDKAIDDYTEVLKMKRKDQDSLLGRAFCHSALKEYSASISDLDRLLAINPSHYEALILKGWAHQCLTLNNQAQADYEAAIALQPKNEKAYMYLANVLRANNNVPQAIVQLDKVLQLSPKSSEAHALKGQMLLAIGQHKEALQQFKTVDRVKVEENYFSLVDRAKASLGAGENQEAIKLLSKAIALKPEMFELYFDRAQAMSSVGEYKKAIKDLDVAIKLYPAYTQALLNRASYNIKLGNEVSAITDFHNAIASAPWTAKPYVEFGKFNLSKKQFVTAKECFDNAVKYDAKDRTARELSLVANQSLKKLVGNQPINQDVNALAKNELAEIGSADFKTLLDKGYAAFKAGRLNYAEAALERAVRIDPNSTAARRYLATTLVAEGKASQAESQVGILQQMGAGQDSDNFRLATANRKAGNCKRAVEFLERHLTTHPTDVNALIDLSENYAAIGDIQKATDVCFTAMNKAGIGPNYARLKERYLSLKQSQTRAVDQKQGNVVGPTPVDTQR